MQGVSDHPSGGAKTPLRRDSLQQQIYERLRNGLVSGAFLPGETVSSRGLAQSLAVSAMPVREALTRLTAEGALELTSSRTLRVRVLTPADFDEVTTIRVELEGMAAERAAGQVTEEDVARVRALHGDLTAAAETADADRYLAANAAFHSGIYAAARWPLLLSMIQRLWLTVGPSIRASVPDHLHMATSMRFHDAAVEAIGARDAEALRAAIVGDIETAAKDIRAFLAEEAGATD
ncbi:GntR family transcriptional regulator [Salipiger mucosus]|uniref:Transcriptional regulator, GntR family n=1 Tax=Salipiger mucosus DSM 16094 TaxID=1123237 RepID=S9R1C9_9RHOB|nr:GntR family transcriptional regulator [Salipiger mucosus]EPX85692.1 Transcriptional regulator, GntR family [Salipiger mucosus DSM 16094]